MHFATVSTRSPSTWLINTSKNRGGAWELRLENNNWKTCQHKKKQGQIENKANQRKTKKERLLARVESTGLARFFLCFSLATFAYSFKFLFKTLVLQMLNNFSLNSLYAVTKTKYQWQLASYKWQRWSREHKTRRQDQVQPFQEQTLLRPRTEMLEAKDTSASALEKKGLKIFFSGNLQKKAFSEKFFRRSTKF